jgi:hypothetical protein
MPEPEHTPEHAALASQAADLAERVLPYFESRHPDDLRPKRAIDAARAWARGEITVGEARDAALGAHDAARETSHSEARAAARVAGHAVMRGTYARLRLYSASQRGTIAVPQTYEPAVLSTSPRRPGGPFHACLNVDNRSTETGNSNGCGDSMREKFKAHFRPSDEEFDRLWQECFFALDANVLLNMHRYSDTARSELFGVLDALADRLWVPHHAADEYLNRLPNVQHEMAQTYKAIEDALPTARAALERKLSGFRYHPTIQKDRILGVFDDALEEIRAYLAECRASHPDDLDDVVLDRLVGLLDGKVGDAFEPNELEEIHKEATRRYKRKQPPGYVDSRKEEPAAFGDYVIWHQLLNEANRRNEPTIFVTDDKKEDWWRQSHGETLGPRPELIEEMASVAGVAYYMYTCERFVKEAQRYTSVKVSEETLGEIRSVSSTPFTDHLIAQGHVRELLDIAQRQGRVQGILDAFGLSARQFPEPARSSLLDPETVEAMRSVIPGTQAMELFRDLQGTSFLDAVSQSVAPEWLRGIQPRPILYPLPTEGENDSSDTDIEPVEEDDETEDDSDLVDKGS